MNFWDRFAGVYDLAQCMNSSVYKEICDITERLTPKGAKVLDCAAGTGELSFAAAEKAESVLCTDISKNMLKQAQRKARAFGIENIEFAERNIFDLQDPDDTYDIVIAGNVLHLLSNTRGAVNEMYRVLKPGGKLLLPTFMTKNKAKPLLALYKKLGYDAESAYSPSEYRRMLEECGMGRVRTKLIHGLVPCCYAVIIKDETDITDDT